MEIWDHDFQWALALALALLLVPDVGVGVGVGAGGRRTSLPVAPARHPIPFRTTASQHFKIIVDIDDFLAMIFS